jgi:uncharacterized protein with PIN domain
MLGRLAHWLRAMGYDTVYLGPADDSRLLDVARREARILVTRDAGLAASASDLGCLIRSVEVQLQLIETVTRLQLTPPESAWLTRCLECNGLLAPVDREAVRDRVPPRVFGIHDDFRVCQGCGRVYWPGSHAGQMITRLQHVLNGAIATTSPASRPER